MLQFTIVLFTFSGFLTVTLCHPFSNKVTLKGGRIIGGNDVDIKDYPHQISLERYGMHICGGSIISETFIVTAAHCTKNYWSQELTVRVGTSVIEEGGLIVDVKKINRHPFYNSSTSDLDIAILELSEALRYDSVIQPIILPNENEELPADTEVSISGWGKIQESDPALSQHLKSVHIYIIDEEKCKLSYSSSEITDNMLCAGVPDGGKDSCQGDSGGGLTYQGKLYGIVSWGRGCGQIDFPGIYVKVSKVRTYISQIVGF